MLTDRILVSDDGTRVVYGTAWAAVEDLVTYAGQDWSTAPVVFPGEQKFLIEPLQLNHYKLFPLQDRRP